LNRMHLAKNKQWSICFLTSMLMVSGGSSTVGAPSAHASETKEAERLGRAAEVLKEIMDAPDQALPRDLLDRSCCLVVIPTMVKGGLLIGGRYGKGVVACRKDLGSGEWGSPSMVTLGGGSFGLQIGGAAVDVVMLVMNPSGIDRLLKDKVTLGGDISVAAGPVGRAATAETDAEMTAKILTYSRSRGVFAGLELKGAALVQDRDGNRNLYGRGIEARELLLAGNTPVPPAARQFIELLTKASPPRTKK
jgi:SH3 domain-containing YSC84-like protein 1